MPGRRYTHSQKVSAVTAAAASSILAAAQETGIPESSIRYWLDKPEFAHLREKTREDLADEWKAIAHLALARIQVLIPTMEPRDLVLAAGLAVDKGQLLSGGATSRTEMQVTEGWADHERSALRDAIRGELEKRDEVPA